MKQARQLWNILRSAATPALGFIVIAFFGGYALFGANGVLAGFEYRQACWTRRKPTLIWWMSLFAANWGLLIRMKSSFRLSRLSVCIRFRNVKIANASLPQACFGVYRTVSIDTDTPLRKVLSWPRQEQKQPPLTSFQSRLSQRVTPLIATSYSDYIVKCS